MAEFFSTYSEAVATIAVFLAGGIATYVGYLIKTRRGNFVQIIHSVETIDLKAPSAFRDEINILLMGEKAETIEINSFKITNEGSEDITSPLTITFKYTPTKIYDSPYSSGVSVEDKQRRSSMDRTDANQANVPGERTLTIKHLNRISAYKDEVVKVGFISSQNMQFEISGSGPRWSIKPISENDLQFASKTNEMIRTAIISLTVIAFLAFLDPSTEFPDPLLVFVFLFITVTTIMFVYRRELYRFLNRRRS